MTEIQKKPLVLTFMITMLCGMGTSLLVLLILLLVDQERWYFIQSTGLYILVLAVGPLVLGALCVSGYFLAAWKLGFKLNSKSIGLIILCQAMIFVLLQVSLSQKAIMQEGQFLPDAALIAHLHETITNRSFWLGLMPTQQYQYGDFDILNKNPSIGLTGYLLLFIDLLNFISWPLIGLWSFRKLDYCDDCACYLKKLSLCEVYQVNQAAPVIKDEGLKAVLDPDYEDTDDFHQLGHIVEHCIEHRSYALLLQHFSQLDDLESPGFSGGDKKKVYFAHCPHCYQGKLNMDTLQLEQPEGNTKRYKYAYRRSFEFDTKEGLTFYQAAQKLFHRK